MITKEEIVRLLHPCDDRHTIPNTTYLEFAESDQDWYAKRCIHCGITLKEIIRVADYYVYEHESNT